MGKIIIECPSCKHVHKLSDVCPTCSTEREWQVKHGGLRCTKCNGGISSHSCEECGHAIPMIDDFAGYYADYVDFRGYLPAFVDEMLETQRYKSVIAVLSTPWIKYEKPRGFPLHERLDSAKRQRFWWTLIALLLGGAIGAGAGILGGQVFNMGEEFSLYLGLGGGALITALFIYNQGGQWGDSRGVLVDGGALVFVSAASAFLLPAALWAVIGIFVLWVVVSMFTD